jgi:hypothetical protein
MGLRDLFNKMPRGRQELKDYVLTNYDDIRKTITSNPRYEGKLEQVVDKSFDKYAKHMGGLTDKLAQAGRAVQFGADAWLAATRDPVTSLGGKFLGLLAKVPEKLYAVKYGLQTGNYLDAGQSVLEGILSYVPGLTFVDQGLTRLVQKRMVSDVVKNFAREAGIYKPWHETLAGQLKNKYTGVKPRHKNIFTPSYKPAAA